MTSLTIILTDLTFILLQLLLFITTYHFFRKRILHPAVLFSLVWLTVIALHFIFKFTLLDQLDSLSLEVYSIFFIGTFFFCAGAAISTHWIPREGKSLNTSTQSNFDIDLNLRILATAVILIGLPFYIQISFRIFLSSQIENFFMGLRNELTNNEADIGPLKYMVPLSYVVLSFNLYAYYNKKSKLNVWLLAFTFLCTTTYAIFATGRTLFFMIFIIYLGMSFIVSRNFSVKKYFISILVFITLFIFFGIILGKGGNSDNEAKENARASSEYLGIYLVTSLNALDNQLQQHSEGSVNGDYSIRFFIKAAMSLDLIPTRKINEPPHIYAFVPYPTNVYTYYSPYISDFGRLYSWMMLALYGALHTALYNAAVYRKSIRSMLYYTFLLFPLLLSFFDDLYLSLFSFWIQLVLFSELLLLINKIIRLKFSSSGIRERLI